MDQPRYIHIRDLSPMQRELTGLPFGLHDDGDMLLKKLHEYVYRRHHSEGKDEILAVLAERYKVMWFNTQGLAQSYERDPTTVKMNIALSPLMDSEFGEKFQLLTTDISFDISDSKIRFTQPAQVFIVGEDNHTWIRTALRVGQLEESEAPTAEPPPLPPPSLPELKPSMQRGAYSE